MAPNIIRQVLRRDVMRESEFYWEIEAEAQARGEAVGIARGKVEGECSLILQQPISSMPIDLQTLIEALSLEQIEVLGEALLKFATQADLTHWQIIIEIRREDKLAMQANPPETI